MAVLPTNAPTGTGPRSLWLGQIGAGAVTFGEQIPGPPGPAGPSLLPMSVPNNPLVTSTGIQPFVATRDMTIVRCNAVCGIGFAPTGSAIIVDVNKNGTTIFTTQSERPTIPAGEIVGTLTVPDITELLEGDILTVDIDAVGSTLPGSYLTLVVEVL